VRIKSSEIELIWSAYFPTTPFVFYDKNDNIVRVGDIVGFYYEDKKKLISGYVENDLELRIATFSIVINDWKYYSILNEDQTMNKKQIKGRK
jgi:hypothetical protein